MIATQLPLFPEISTGTSATALIPKGLSPFGSGTCSGTQVEQRNAHCSVPPLQVEQEHKRNRKTRYKTTAYATCSGVPVAITNPERSLFWETELETP
jgi:hypothetical protein